jgi:hypothetical protein
MLENTTLEESTKLRILREWDEDLDDELDIDDYLVLTDEEATSAAQDVVKSSLWTFSVDSLYDFIPNISSFSYYQDKAFRRILKNLLENECESADVVLELLLGENLDDFVDEMISNAGRGQFLASYDNEEHYVDYNGVTYYIYRTN